MITIAINNMEQIWNNKETIWNKYSNINNDKKNKNTNDDGNKDEILTYSFSFCDINNIKYFYARLPHRFLNQLKFFGCLLFFLNPIPSISQLYYCCYCYYYYIFHNHYYQCFYS